MNRGNLIEVPQLGWIMGIFAQKPEKVYFKNYTTRAYSMVE